MSHFTPEDHLKAIGAVEVSPRPQEGHTGASFAATLFTLMDPSEIPPRACFFGRHQIRKHR
jgi:hypothetical protein